MRRKRWYVSGSISNMNGGLFFKFIFDCWHCRTTLSISFHVLSSVFLSVDIFCGLHASEKAPCNFEKIDDMFLVCCIRVRLAAILDICSTQHNTQRLLGLFDRHDFCVVVRLYAVRAAAVLPHWHLQCTTFMFHYHPTAHNICIQKKPNQIENSEFYFFSSAFLTSHLWLSHLHTASYTFFRFSILFIHICLPLCVFLFFSVM